MSRSPQVQAHNDNQRDYLLQRIDELVSTLHWYRQLLQRVDPNMSQRDRRVLMFAVVRTVDAYRGDVSSTGVLLQVARHFGVRS